jgi:hypothetical protein
LKTSSYNHLKTPIAVYQPLCLLSRSFNCFPRRSSRSQASSQRLFSESTPSTSSIPSPRVSSPSPTIMTATTTNGTDSSEGLFTSDLVSPTIAAQLPESYTIRALQKSDYARGFLDCLRVLTTVGDITEAQWDDRYDWMNGQGKGGYYLLVIDDGKRIVGTGALIVERKL